MENKIYTIAVGRGVGNAEYTIVECSPEELEIVALAIYRGAKGRISTKPLMVAYSEGTIFDWDNHKVLIDCM